MKNMRLIKSFILIYASFVMVVLPLLLYKIWVNKNIPGGINEAFEGLVLYLFLAVPLSIGFFILVYLVSMFDSSIFIKKYLTSISLIAGALIFYIRIGYGQNYYVLELLISIIVLSLFLVFKNSHRLNE